MNGHTKYPTFAYVKHPSLKDSYPVVSNITQEIFDSAINFNPDPGDTFVVSYPKNGTTWVMNILYLLRNNGVPLPKGESLDSSIPFLEFEGGSVVEKSPQPRIIKSHLYRSLIPFREDVKYVFVARNPKDVAVSFFYHIVGFDEYYHFANGKFDDYFEVFLAGQCDFGDYFKFVSEWLKESDKRSNVHMILYEDMKNDVRREILKLAEFLGDDHKEKLLKDNEKLLNDIIKHSSFSKMKETVESFCLEDRPSDIPFVRKGVIGDWKNHLSRDQSERIEKRIAETDQQCPGFAQLWANYEHLLKF